MREYRDSQCVAEPSPQGETEEGGGGESRATRRLVSLRVRILGSCSEKEN